MSRSYKRPWVVDQSWKYWGKRWAARRLRKMPFEAFGNYMNYKRYYPQYDICDYKWLVTPDSEFYQKVRRK